MYTEFQLKQEVCLNKTNFNEWSFLIKNALMAKKVSDYVDKDLITPLEIQVNSPKICDADIYSNLSNQLKTAKSYDALAITIINSIVPMDALKHIKNLQTAFDIMTKLKEIYKGSKNADVYLLMNKLYSLKAKCINECKDVISEIKEIFSSLEKHRSILGN
ncbi:hypothetical protein H8356DRAFT_1073872 [Neocallimastix lanati (nom. inval.)]|uniref:Uncharacterized protein n=1 Tax=Neocallimastix californiae TaxID=1754190 RepID=A0A1Y2BTJ5_9FUNG|nr:hypothetical protein H8356DRAFT_1073872 [Neocallimastix sp. JGI-2020a]ORY38071.1 hypothetical protein LY90DRAFT_510979 [Neocallimastix californiae]|eukprot:ORY38071.1 hypothetical protein LY90DRAFT_510979 [Neocallimastix californiae]